MYRVALPLGLQGLQPLLRPPAPPALLPQLGGQVLGLGRPSVSLLLRLLQPAGQKLHIRTRRGTHSLLCVVFHSLGLMLDL
ncbi:hypothetical protein EYF80_037037 [Liparis tanakae]|uniref:Uncharacterized protein n=1 Tax=Liparis tanakae TaxID=230148 RepID=A0A4Z2GIP3_9TELE|nr:hypothetical protein EYF80_037037 [Liparis tanakae]